MKTHLRRLSFAVGTAVTVMLLTMPLGQAGSGPQPNPAILKAQNAAIAASDVSTQAKADAYAQTHPVTASDLALAADVRANVGIAKDGTLVTASPKYAHDISRINAGLRAYLAQQGAVHPELGTIQAAAYWCFYMPGWAFELWWYYSIISVGAVGIIAAVAYITVAGVGLGLALTILGISLGVTVAIMDHIFSERGYYRNGAWLCH